ncbi:MAG: hypothetical protein KAQ91_01470 [Methylococcales bacterium]|nr:hypothetical protein [Methylococcales bacterium]
MSECECKTEQDLDEGLTLAAVADTPSVEPPLKLNQFDGDNTMSDIKPTLMPPANNLSESETEAETAIGEPTLTPPPASMAAAEEGGVTAWLNNKRVSALWSRNQNRNSWVYIANVGWKKLADNSDSAVVALSMLSAHAKQTQTNYSYREESGGKIHEVYVW